MINRIVYLGYYLKKLDRVKLKKFNRYVKNNYDISRFSIWKNVMLASLKYNISILDYYYFRFFERSKDEKLSYAGTGYMYEYQLLMNPIKSRNILENKLIFLKEYASFINHGYCTKKEFLENDPIVKKLLSNKAQKLVLKSSDGQCGEGIEVLDLNKMSIKSLEKKIRATENDLLEEFIVQHDALMRLSPAGLNTIRIFTQLNKKDGVELLGARLRITINSYVDNLAAGNIAAPIDEETGIVSGQGVYSDITKVEETKHPITGVDIIGFQVPFWKESIKMVKEAALMHKQNRSIGWDVAITNKGPELLEGNHNWCKLLWQLPVKKGLKHKLEPYL